MIDLKTMINPKTCLVPAIRTGDATGTTVDRKGAQSLTFLVHVGVGGITFDGSNKIDVIMEESDDDSSWSACTDADVIGATSITSGIVKSFVVEHAAAAVYHYGYRGNKRYARVKLDYTGTHGTGTPTSVVGVLGHLQNSPVIA